MILIFLLSIVDVFCCAHLCVRLHDFVGVLCPHARAALMYISLMQMICMKKERPKQKDTNMFAEKKLASEEKNARYQKERGLPVMDVAQKAEAAVNRYL